MGFTSKAMEDAAKKQRIAAERYQSALRWGWGFANNPDWIGASEPYGLVNVAPTCNCRNCGAPFAFEERICSYCRSDR